ncbi:MAG TPA: efflux RND transporter periplasmic adaptor subunit, partial [Polyangiaceae bacterium]|nr:efflux RND transporter periplasmic adaptor subunit [Polyangiaceae bacterium]
MNRWLLLVAMLCVGACNKKAETHEGEHEHEPAPAEGKAEEGDHGHEELLHRVTVSNEVAAAAGIKTVPVGRAVLSGALSLPGEIASDPDRMARISSPAAGRIEEVRFREGEAVKKGAVLAVIRVPEIAKVRSAYLATQAKAKAARANAGRLRELLGQRLAAEQAVIDAEAEAEALELEARSSADQLGALGAGAAGAFSIVLKSPLDGTVVARNAVVGQSASAEEPLGTVADLTEVWFLARVFEKDLGRLKVGANAEV